MSRKAWMGGNWVDLGGLQRPPLSLKGLNYEDGHFFQATNTTFNNVNMWVQAHAGFSQDSLIFLTVFGAGSQSMVHIGYGASGSQVEAIATEVSLGGPQAIPMPWVLPANSPIWVKSNASLQLWFSRILLSSDHDFNLVQRGVVNVSNHSTVNVWGPRVSRPITGDINIVAMTNGTSNALHEVGFGDPPSIGLPVLARGNVWDFTLVPPLEWPEGEPISVRRISSSGNLVLKFLWEKIL